MTLARSRPSTGYRRPAVKIGFFIAAACCIVTAGNLGAAEGDPTRA